MRVTTTDIKSKCFYVFRFTIDADTGLVMVADCATPGVRPCLDYDFSPTVYRLSVKGTYIFIFFKVIFFSFNNTILTQS